jgi:hypothetical protein
MEGPLPASEALDAELARLDRERLLVLQLDDLDGLVREPSADAFGLRRGPYRAGVDDLVLTLTAATRLPDELTVRIVLPPGAPCATPVQQVQAALEQRARDASSASWREAVAVRNMGRRQLPGGLALAALTAAVAYGAVYLASAVDALAGKAVLVALGGIAITVAWVVSWMVVESFMIDWRQSARTARAYDLLARATLEVVREDPQPGG